MTGVQTCALPIYSRATFSSDASEEKVARESYEDVQEDVLRVGAGHAVAEEEEVDPVRELAERARTQPELVEDLDVDPTGLVDEPHGGIGLHDGMIVEEERGADEGGERRRREQGEGGDGGRRGNSCVHGG